MVTVRRPPLSGPTPPVKVITYNTASGNNRYNHVPQAGFADLPMYQDIIQGRPGAGILAAQEVGAEQVERLRGLSKNGNFTVVAVAPKPGQSNLMLIPKRYEVLEQQSSRFVRGQLAGAADALKHWVRTGQRPNLFQLVEPRAYTELALRDRESGKTFTVFNTHVSIEGPVRVQQMRELMERVAAAKRKGPVILAGDLNTRADGGRYAQDRYDEEIRRMISGAGLQDMGGPVGAPGRNIDFVLADGFESVSTRYYTGDQISMPGLPNARAVSDHFAEEDQLRFR
jgi:endonuclease/exonuclease/phosphatase family metal-dependent hydrolase